MDYMESVKQLEEKLVLNQQKHDRDGKSTGQVLPFMQHPFCYVLLKEVSCVLAGHICISQTVCRSKYLFRGDALVSFLP